MFFFKKVNLPGAVGHEVSSSMTSTEPHAPDTLLALAQAGDLSAFSQVMAAEQPRLLAQALAFCGDPDQAQDLVQETMIAAWKSFSRFDGSCRLFTWLYVILLRQHQRMLGWFSRRLPVATLAQQLAAARNEPALEPGVGSEDDSVLRAMVEALPQRHREVVRLRFYGEASENEIAAALGISEGTVKSRLHHGLEKLRRMKEKLNGLRDPAHEPFNRP
jgi:RNA polymerase sigma-70 factor, ECF subfamily